MYWNHNSAYYPWIKKKTDSCKTILDVGCGDGSLALFLNDGTKRIVGIDIDIHSIEKANANNDGNNVDFYCCNFADYSTDMKFDAIVFVASIHHMNMTKSLQKAKSLLSPSGKLLIVGIAEPSTILDWIFEAVRIIPSKLISAVHNMKTSEELEIKTDYHFLKMNDVRSIIRQELPGASIKYALHYRYLLEWTAQ